LISFVAVVIGLVAGLTAFKDNISKFMDGRADDSRIIFKAEGSDEKLGRHPKIKLGMRGQAMQEIHDESTS
jgi:hypothetical protein